MKTFLSITKVAFLGLISLFLVCCQESNEELTLSTSESGSKALAATPVTEALGAWQRVFTDNFDNTGSFNNWQRTSRFDYNSNLCQYDAAVPTIANWDYRNVLV